MPCTYVYLAGINNSGPQHWQRLWQEQQGGLWVEHSNWDEPVASLWMAELTEKLDKQTGKLVLIGHSLGALLAAQWLAQGGRAHAVYLVALPDAQGPQFPKVAGGFADARVLDLTVPARIVASRDDPYASVDFAFDASVRWRAGFWELGAKGHINAASGLGAWAEGWQDLQKFLGGLQS